MKDEMKNDGLNDPQTIDPKTDLEVAPAKDDDDGGFPIEPPAASNTPPVHIDPPPPPAYK